MVRLLPTAQAIAATAKRRGTDIPQSLLDAFTPEFFRDPSKLQQWPAFTCDLSAETPLFEVVIPELWALIGPLVNRARALVRQRSED
jgi:hypothetical protein